MMRAVRQLAGERSQGSAQGDMLGGQVQAIQEQRPTPPAVPPSAGGGLFAAPAQPSAVDRAQGSRGQPEEQPASQEAGPFGPIFSGLTNQPEAAITKLMAEKKGQVPDAFLHPELGPIAFVYGDEKMGLRHIDAKRGPEWIEKIPSLLRQGEVVADPSGLPRTYLVRKSDKPASVAVIRLDWNRQKKTWLVTAFPDDFAKFVDQEKSGASQKRTGRADDGGRGFSAPPDNLQNTPAAESSPPDAPSSRLDSAASALDAEIEKAAAELARSKAKPTSNVSAPAPAKSSASDGTQNSRGQGQPAGQTAKAQQARDELNAYFGADVIESLERTGQLVIHADESALPPEARGTGVRGWYSDGVAHLFPQNILVGNVPSVLLHEGGVHGTTTEDSERGVILRALGLRGQEAIRRFDRLRREGSRRDREIAEQALQMAANELEQLRAEGVEVGNERLQSEALAYLVELASAKPNTLPLAMRQFIADLVAALKAYALRSPLALAMPERVRRRMAEDWSAADFVRAARQQVRLASGVGNASSAFSRGGAFDATSPEFREQIAALERQHAEVLRAHREQGAPLPAPNGQPSNLTAGQWLTVRTPNFKRWFGDWEAEAGRRALSAAEPAQLTGREFSSKDGGSIKAMREEARAYALKNIVGAHTNALSGMTVEVRKKGIDSTISHGSGPDNLRVLAAIPDVLRNGAVTFNGVNPKNPDADLIVITRRVFVGEVEFMVSAGVRKDPNGTLYYDHELLDVRSVDGRSSKWEAGAEAPKSASLPTSTRLNNYTARFLAQSDADVSNVVDANGEPLVVYHGTDRSFDAFSAKAESRHISLPGFLRQYREQRLQNQMRESACVSVPPYDPMFRTALGSSRTCRAMTVSIPFYNRND